MTRMHHPVAAAAIAAALLVSACTTAAPAGPASSAASSAAPSAPVEISYWFPVDLGGGLAKTMQTLVDRFNGSHPDIHVTATYTGNYDATLQKIQAGQLAGNLPAAAVIVNEHTQLLAPTGVLANLDSYVQQAGGDKFKQQFFPSLLLNSSYGGHFYSLPYQRSVPVLYYNKDLFTAAGIAAPPTTWQEWLADAKKLTVRDASGNVTRWGVEIPLEAYNWIYYALVYESGGKIISDDLKTLYLDQPPAAEAMRFWRDLVRVAKVTPSYTPWAQGSQDFVAQKTASLVYSSGAQQFFRDSAKFGWSLVKIPQNKRFGVAPGGGNLVIFKHDEATQRAAWTFATWMVEPAQTAFWSINSGYIAVQPAAWDLPEMKALAAKYPEVLVTVDQLKDAFYEPGAPNFTKVRDLLHDTTQDILSGKTTVQNGLQKVTSEGNKILQGR